MSELGTLELNWAQYQINVCIELGSNTNSIVWMYKIFASWNLWCSQFQFLVWMYIVLKCVFLPPAPHLAAPPRLPHAAPILGRSSGLLHPQAILTGVLRTTSMTDPRGWGRIPSMASGGCPPWTVADTLHGRRRIPSMASGESPPWLAVDTLHG